ncbi:MAG TPA: MBL fold metallo-hydrolase [Bryobacteraceae bacterium]|jgi:glyoxylase-like metal-dependent hydrolase (beta-lactamase superfamily II)|nr:MBL fold metallo-hydrolase [Bryobacteraceae bacterium]
MLRNAFAIGFGFAALLLAQAPPGGGRGQQAAAPFMTHQLKPNVYWIEGGGGNSGVIVGDKGVIVIDAKTSAAGGKELLEDIAKITPKPVTAVILTHSDGDHVNGLASFPAGVKVIAQENNKKEQEAALKAGGRGAPPADHLPTQVITKPKETIKLEGVKFELHHWAPAHTSGDLIVYLPAEKIVFTGDIIGGAGDPLIHLEKNGSSEGWITTVKGMAALNADQFVAGHGDLRDKAFIQKKLADITEKRAKIKDLVAQGKSLDDIRTAVGDPAPPAGRAGGGGRGGFASFTQVVYEELTKKPAA